jgi:hypothetical protein
MVDLRRNSSEPPLGRPVIQHAPGSADKLMREIAPLLAGDGIDINSITDVNELNRAIQKATDRRNMELFTPIGARREQATALLSKIVQAIADDDSELAGALLAQAVPESPDDSAAEVSSCIGLALGLLDDWLSGRHPGAPKNLTAITRLPRGQWFGKRAGTNVLALASKGRSFAALGSLITGQGSHQLQAGSALVLAGAISSWSRSSGTPVADLIAREIR